MYPFENAGPNKVAEILVSTRLFIDKEAAKNRMKVLNTLKACVGQEHRALLTHFLYVKKWIGDRQTPDEWPLEHLPRNQTELLSLADEIDEFSRRQAKEAEATSHTKTEQGVES